MTPSKAVGRTAVLTLCLATLGAKSAESQELINRREEARAAIAATPQSLYAHYCAHCHGDDATGSGRLWASDLSPQPTDLTALTVDQDYLVAAIRDGSAAHGKSNLCPPWGRTITPADIERLAHYIASLGSQSAQARTEPAGTPNPVREPIPWLLAGLVLAEFVLLREIFRRRKVASNVLSQDPSLRG